MEDDTSSSTMPRVSGRLHMANMFRELYYALAKRLLEDLPVDEGQRQALTALDTSMMAALLCLDASYVDDVEAVG